MAAKPVGIRQVIGKEDGPWRLLRAMEDELVAKSLWLRPKNPS